MPYADRERQLEAMRNYMTARRSDLGFKADDKARVKAYRNALYQTNPELARQYARENYRRTVGSIGMQKPFLAYDGEAIANRYVLLANSRESVSNMHGLSSGECLEFLTRPYDDNPFRVIFASDYDVTKIMQDAPFEKLEELAHTSHTTYEGFKIVHYPGKILRLRSLSHGARDYVYFDVWGFFQRSFLAVVDEYLKQGIYLSDGDKATLEWGKAARVAFRRKDFARMVEYNRIECELLEAVMNRLRAAVNGAGMRPTQWHGPGVLAEIFLDRARSRKWVNRGFQSVPLRRAYFGGRIEVLQRGSIPGPIYDYDIRSAYPYALANYRTANGDYLDTTEYVPGVVGLYSVAWNIAPATLPAYGSQLDAPAAGIIGPFPYRSVDGSIHFPPQGRGIYHAVEVDAAVDAYGLATEASGPGVWIERGRIAAPGTQPFKSIVEQWYEKRLQHKRAKDITEVAYKMALNSAYGKLAQRVGRRKHGDMFLAGYITAATRAMMLRVTSAAPAATIAFATDGILTTEPLEVELGEALGQWDLQTFDSVDVLMSGIYRLHRGDEQIAVKSRGWSQLDFDTVMDALHNRALPGGFEIQGRAFVTYRMAVHSRFTYGPLLGTFVERYRFLSPETESKRMWYSFTPIQRDSESESGFGVAWSRSPQYSIARPLTTTQGEVIQLARMEASQPINDRQAPSDDVWIVSPKDAEAALMLDGDGLPLSEAAEPEASE